MKNFFKFILIILIILIATFFGFYFWGSSKTISKKEYLRGYMRNINCESAKEVMNIQGEKAFSIITYNMGFASGMANCEAYQPDRTFYDENLKNIKTLLSSYNPDFVAVQEIDANSKRSYYVDQLDAIAKTIETPFVAFAPNFSKKYVPFPYWPISAHWGKTLSGQAVFSKHKIINHKIYKLSQPETFSKIYLAFYIDRLIQETSINIGEEDLIIINVHLEAWDLKTREKQAQKLIAKYNEIKEKPVIILGDFNTAPPYATRLNKFPEDSTGEEDYTGEKTIGTILNEKTLKSAISKEQYLADESSYFTYPSDKPSRKIDFIFYNDKIQPIESKVIKDNRLGSDHLPVYLKFKIK